jgi:hypothetical protein
MPDLTNLDDLAGEDLTEPQIKAILAQIDLDITNLVREGKLSALRYEGSGGSPTADRAANLEALLAARKHYEALLHALPAWEISSAS